MMGLLMTFPPESLPAIYNVSPILAYPGVFIAGIGDPFMTIATLRALLNMQVISYAGTFDHLSWVYRIYLRANRTANMILILDNLVAGS